MSLYIWYLIHFKPEVVTIKLYMAVLLKKYMESGELENCNKVKLQSKLL